MLHSFGFDGGYGSTGTRPADGLIIGGQPVNDPDTTDDLGRKGTIFRMTRSGKVGVVHTFMGEGGGLQPLTALVQSTTGKLFGMAWGGSADRGIAYRYAPGARPFLKDVGADPPEVWAGDRPSVSRPARSSSTAGHGMAARGDAHQQPAAAATGPQQREGREGLVHSRLPDHHLIV